ncbi:MAG: hypothetical protein AABZ60_18940 [Planctomycetota bacterium]
MANKRQIVELIQVKKEKSLWMCPDTLLYFEKQKAPTGDEIILHLKNGKKFHIIDSEPNRKKLQLQFNLIM